MGSWFTAAQADKLARSPVRFMKSFIKVCSAGISPKSSKTVGRSSTANRCTMANATFNSPSPESSIPLAGAGEVSVCGQTARFSRPSLTEEYSVSMDGVQQDFIVEQASPIPPGGELVVKLAVAGAQVEAAADGARLVLTHSGRKIAYSRLRVTDATGKELPARIEICPVGDEVMSLNSSDLFGNDVEESSPLTSAPTSGTLAVVVNDAEAVY